MTTKDKNLEKLVIELSANYSRIIPIDELQKHSVLSWGRNGIGDRWANKKFNYSVIYSNKSCRTYSETEDDTIPDNLLSNFLRENKVRKGIIGIYVYSQRNNNDKRPINKSIHRKITRKSCVICGTNYNIVCDHKNDLYNDTRVLNVETQRESDFQPLCNHCNLQKRQVCKKEKHEYRLYSAKNIHRYQQHKFEFPWEKKVFDITDINCKNDTYWFDPVEFENKISCYLSYIIPVIKEVKYKVNIGKIKRCN
jgi:hypothetical protein